MDKPCDATGAELMSDHPLAAKIDPMIFQTQPGSHSWVNPIIYYVNYREATMSRLSHA